MSADGSIVIDCDVNVSEADKALKDLENKISDVEKEIGDGPKDNALAESINSAKEKAGELEKVILNISKMEFAPGYSKEALEYVENYTSKVEAATGAENEMKQALESARATLKSLEGQGKWFGDEEYDRAALALQRINSDIKEYKNSIFSGERPENPFGLDTIQGKVREAEIALSRLKEAGKGLGDAEYDKAYRSLALLKAEAKGYAAELGKTPAQAEKEAEALAKVAQRAEQVAAKEAEAAAEAEKLKSIASNARVSNQTIVDLNQELTVLKERLAELKSAGVGIGYEEYDEIEQRISEINAEIRDYGSGLTEATRKTKSMGSAMERAQRSAGKFLNRVKGLVLRSFVFTVISRGLASVRSWLVKVIKSDSDAVSAIVRLKGALLTLVQPLVDVIIPAFTTFANVLTEIITAMAAGVAAMFGTSIDESREAAEKLYEESEAIEETGDAAKEASKSMAEFDEVNKIVGSAETPEKEKEKEDEKIKPDFTESERSWLTDILGNAAAWVAAAIMLGGIAFIAIGAATGSLAKVIFGLVLLGVGVAVASETGVLQSWVETLGLNSVQEFVVLAVLLAGIAIIAIGAAFGNIFLVLAGLALIYATIKYTESSGMMQDWVEALGLSKAAQWVTAALLIGGFALIIIGAILKNILMVLAGLALIAAGIYVGKKAGTLNNWWEVLGIENAASYITAALLIGGIALVVFGIALKNILMLVAGLGMIGAGYVYGKETGTFDKWWEVLGTEKAESYITAALIIGGIALVIFGIVLANVLMFIVGLGMLGAGLAYGTGNGTIDNWWDTLGLDKYAEYITAAMLIGGMAFIVFGIITGNILMAIGGIVLLGIGIAFGDKKGTLGTWWDALGLPEVPAWVSIALQMAGIALIAIGAALLNPMLIIAGLGLLGASVALGAFNSKTLSQNKSFSGISNPRASMPSISTYQAPALATGAVIPPNHEFLAKVGDQKSGVNIETPLSTMVQAFKTAIQESNLGGGTVIMELDGQRFGKAVFNASNRESRRVGVRLVEV